MKRKIIKFSGASIGSAFLALLLILSAACSDRPKEIIPEKEMIQLLADMHVAEAMRQTGGMSGLPDSVRRNIGEAILAKRGYTYARLDTTLGWYGRHVDKYFDLFDQVDKELAKRQKKIDSDAGIAVETGENLWPYPDHIYFSPLGNTSGINFSVDGAPLAKGDMLKWEIRLLSDGNLKGTLGVKYSDGSTSFMTASTYGEKHLKMTFMTDTSKTVSRIYGTLSLPRSAMPLWADSVQLRKLPYDSTEYYKINSQRNYRK